MIVVVINVLSNTLPINGQTAGEVSNRLQVLLTPAGYVFSIWSFIYLLLGIWIFRQLSNNQEALESSSRIGESRKFS